MIIEFWTLRMENVTNAMTTWHNISVKMPYLIASEYSVMAMEQLWNPMLWV